MIKNNTAIKYCIVFLVITGVVLATSGCTGSGAATNPSPTAAGTGQTAGSGTQSEASYKAACQQVPIGDLTKSADGYKGQKVKYTGQILAMDFPKDTDSGKTPYGIILSVSDASHTLPSGVLPLYVSYPGETDSFVYDNVTVYGEVYGNYTYKSATVAEKTLPRVDVAYMEKAP